MLRWQATQLTEWMVMDKLHKAATDALYYLQELIPLQPNEFFYRDIYDGASKACDNLKDALEDSRIDRN